MLVSGASGPSGVSAVKPAAKEVISDTEVADEAPAKVTNATNSRVTRLCAPNGVGGVGGPRVTVVVVNKKESATVTDPVIAMVRIKRPHHVLKRDCNFYILIFSHF